MIVAASLKDPLEKKLFDAASFKDPLQKQMFFHTMEEIYKEN